MAQEDKVKKVKAEKAKESALTHDLSGGDARPNFKKVQAKSTEKSQKGKKQQKVKSPKKERTDFEIADDKRIKEEANDADFMPEKKGKKRKRKLESVEGPSSSTALSLPKKKKKEKASQEGDESFGPEKRKKKAEAKNKKVKKEEEEHPVAVKKTKKTKEEIEAARALKIKKKEEEEQQRWRWWEEEKYADGIKWKFLEHNGPYFPPEYQPLPDKVKFYYDGKPVKLSLAAEEVALFFAQMLDHEYTTKDVFRDNFFADWRKEMTLEERMLITDLNKCDFGELHAMHRERVEARKNMSKEEKLVIKEANQKILEEYGYCMLDKHRERIGNFKIEPPALFRGRGEHPKQGMLKKRIRPEDVTINCSRDSRIPVPPAGHSWKEVRHDNTVTWLASWTENIQGSCKYVMLNANSKLKGEKDWEKYEVARKLKTCVDAIRAQYQQDLKSKQMGVRQRAVALYFIDKLALRAGNEKEEGETADTVGCCSLRVEHITLHDTLGGDKCVVEFDFLGKDCIRYYNKVPVSKRVFKNLKLFMQNKQETEDLFDRLNTALLNKHLSSLMPGLTAKVFRTYNASMTLQQQLKELSNPSDNQAEKLLSYNRANRAVAVLCNHQRAAPKTFEQSMANLQAKIESRKEQLALAKKELKQAKKEAKANSDSKLLAVVEKKKKTVHRCEEQLLRMEVQATDKEENKQIALSTSKLNYLDPRISVAWCKNMEVPLDKIYNKTQRDKFAWAIDMTELDFMF
ncbi:DNA topoisomerase I, mitochondrial isoform X1 [Tachysurus fulvidraco]|uniref:DNA topoisomerase I, mitochondrial isoform X1 n=1 Tax=Tachysurus fulvidraco TaxID=1234273 RepID=UPI001FED9114|nr:DNA topoisomerase I, mitochondrial isoform X1 [Tachysurus fulvidraco]XP_027017554.2 DNA topoisomerase I, mitochondrial isoform X1 [Tachysurus fulvidraco]XP_027017555.2 DNA topoisomerase I, mitochondrial isoform X1 [Tachysurus fulvidraco]XP_027017556.2 DNA topoisomerase I, mitochondrial isoform X1 [Tachysurus fulvidraco]XP_027017557.2 DNA topoisomerase I, mitochondrial isoform X1 [Tachysurus fulvidraco]XP_027017558.2 DNA topoisomerase I, mitochondrial isoform X1 [Tachysurus fulvidraco]